MLINAFDFELEGCWFDFLQNIFYAFIISFFPCNEHVTEVCYVKDVT